MTATSTFVVSKNATRVSPRPKAATAALQNDYKCYTAPGTGPRVVFLAKNTLVLHILEVVYSLLGLAVALRLQLSHGPQCTLVYVYFKLTVRDKKEVDHFIPSMCPYDIIMGRFNNVIWAASPTCPWLEG